jgi:hypothetical protein
VVIFPEDDKDQEPLGVDTASSIFGTLNRPTFRLTQNPKSSYPKTIEIKQEETLRLLCYRLIFAYLNIFFSAPLETRRHARLRSPDVYFPQSKYTIPTSPMPKLAIRSRA